MKTVLHLPYGFGRSAIGKYAFNRAQPVFNVKMLDDEGGNISDAYPSSVRFGPELYRFLRQVVPAIAARRGEDNVFEGIVDPRPQNIKDQYAYYGWYGENPITHRPNPGYGLVGFGNDPNPGNMVTGSGSIMHDLGKSTGSIENVVKLAAPSLIPSKNKSQVLTNILNGAQDFNPFFAPVHKYVDPDYDPNNDPDGKGPRPTDRWVPRRDPVTGMPMYNDQGKQLWMPVPRVQLLPIYNFSHPKWEEDPEAAWDMVKDLESLKDWKNHGIAPAYSDFKGETHMSKRSGEPFPYDFYEQNMKVASTPGYYDDDPDLQDALDKLKQYQLDRKWKGIYAAREADVDAYQQEKVVEAAQSKAKGMVSNANGGESDLTGKKGDMSQVRNRYRGVINVMLKNPNFADRLSGMGVSSGDRIPMLDMIMKQPDKYNKYQDDNAKMLVILDDYGKERDAVDRRNNIVSGVSGL